MTTTDNALNVDSGVSDWLAYIETLHSHRMELGLERISHVA